MKFKFLSLVIGLLMVSNASVADIETKKQKDIALKFEPFDYLFGSFNAELEFAVDDDFSIYVPFFFAHHDAAAIKDVLFWNSSLGINIGAKFHINSKALNGHGFFVAADTGVFVVYPFEQGEKKVLYKGIYSELSYEKNPFWLPVFNFYTGYEWVSKSGFLIEVGAGLSMYAEFPVPLIKTKIGYAF